MTAPTAGIVAPSVSDQPSAARLTGLVVPVREITADLTDRLYALFRQYYTHADRDTFARDQAEKDWVLLLVDHHGEAQGFTTLKLYERAVAGRLVRAVFSGNTIVERAYWGQQELVRTWCRFLARLKSERPELPLYWFLICSGYRTYLYLPLFFREFFPRHDRPTPPFEQLVIDELAGEKFPAEYADGIVHVGQPRECLLPELALPPMHKRENEHVRYFLERNAGFLRGDELVCITEFSLENTRRLAHAEARAVLAARAEG